MSDLKHVYKRQLAAEDARQDVSETYERVYWDLDPRARERVNVYEHPSVVLAKVKADALTAEVAALRELVGGRVFRVVDSKLTELRARIEKLNKKAVKLGTEPVTLTVSDEHDQMTFREDGKDWVFDYTFVTVNGETPMIAGWAFVASLDHEADEGADMSTAIRRAPVGAFMRSRIGEEAATAVENADLTAYRHASNDCDHCGFNRRRKQTYVLYEVATGELRQIGSTCLKDYTGAHNPDRIAAWAEWLEALYSDLESDSDGFGGSEGGGGRIAIRTIEFLAHVSAMIKERGWQSRWRKSGYGDFERNFDATADVAMGNIFARKDQVPVTDEDQAEAQAALDWVRDLDEGEEELDEFLHNLTTYCRSDYVPAKGDGFIAYAIMARRRAVEKELETKRQAEAVADSEWIGEVKERLRGLRFHVTFTREFDSQFGTKLLTKGHDDDGNLLVWWSSSRFLEQGHVYELDGTVKRHDTDDYNGGAKVTEITRVAAKSIKDVTPEEATTR